MAKHIMIKKEKISDVKKSREKTNGGIGRKMKPKRKRNRSKKQASRKPVGERRVRMFAVLAVLAVLCLLSINLFLANLSSDDLTGNAVMNLKKVQRLELGLNLSKSFTTTYEIEDANAISLDIDLVDGVESADVTAVLYNDETRMIIYMGKVLDSGKELCSETCSIDLKGGVYKIDFYSESGNVIVKSVNIHKKAIRHFELVNHDFEVDPAYYSVIVPIEIKNPDKKGFKLFVRPAGANPERVALDTSYIEFADGETEKWVFAEVFPPKGSDVPDPFATIVISFIAEHRHIGMTPFEVVHLHSSEAEPQQIAASPKKQAQGNGDGINNILFGLIGLAVLYVMGVVIMLVRKN